MKEHKKKMFVVTIEKRVTFETEVEAFDERGARGQLTDKGEVIPEKIANWRATGEAEFVLTGAREIKNAVYVPALRRHVSPTDKVKLPLCPLCKNVGRLRSRYPPRLKNF